MVKEQVASNLHVCEDREALEELWPCSQTWDHAVQAGLPRELVPSYNCGSTFCRFEFCLSKMNRCKEGNDTK